VLVLEDLNVEGLIRNGTKKRRLRLHDSSFSELRAVLEWQFLKCGKTVLALPAYNSLRECFLCGRINKGLTLEDRVFHCPFCGFTLDRDLNASLVLLKRAGWVPSAVPAPPNTSSTLPWVKKEEARRGFEAGSHVRKGVVVHHDFVWRRKRKHHTLTHAVSGEKRRARERRGSEEPSLAFP